jgi:hypothetical protein
MKGLTRSQVHIRYSIPLVVLYLLGLALMSNLITGAVK